MGLFDKIKGKVKDAIQQPQSAQQQAQQQNYHQQQYGAEAEAEAADDEDGHGDSDSDSDGDGDAFDLAGFDPVNDEESFFHAVLHMESDGQYGGTDESRAEIMARFGIRDRSHWHTVKDSCYAMLVRKWGSGSEVSQREMNWRSGQMQQHMQGQIAKMAAGGGFTTVEGVSLEAWAAFNAAIVSGANLDDLLKGQAIDRARWDRINAEWNARMARDTTFAIAQVYGNAFQAASRGKYGDYAREAAAARAQNRELAVQPPLSWEQYYELMLEQKYADKQGKDPVATLQQLGLSIVDWTDLSTFMGYHFHRTAQRFWPQYEEIHKRLDAKYAAKYPGVDVDISF